MIYLDNSATSRYHHKCVLRAYLEGVTLASNPGRSAHKDSLYMLEKVEKVRDSVRRLVHADYNVVFTKNCTEALNLAILGTLKSGDHVVTTSYEHNSVLRPLYHLENQGVISLTVVSPDSDGYIQPYRIQDTLRPNTSLVVCNHLSNVTGMICDIEKIGKICAREGVRFLVDGAQSVGHMDIDMISSNIDMLACPSHKGLGGVMGSGFLVFNDRSIPSPITYGGTGTESDSIYQPFSPPSSMESGTLNLPGILALGEAIRTNMLDRANIVSRIMDMTAYLISRLSSIDEVTVYTKPSSIYGVVSFNIGDMDSGEVADLLSSRYNIAVRAGIHCAPLCHKYLGTLDRGTVRASIGANNTLLDIRRLCRAVYKIAKSRR
ncbi:MAG: aminotransferase class V-fold PLP-dependent enzyme [Clostridia bacterium]|nr:aminotransferase class V-fold PLP-dependent enzyme [Clostridia bacterium]